MVGVVLGILFAIGLLQWRHGAWRAARGFDAPDYPWPALSVIIPAHNEEAYIGATVANLRAQQYPGRLEIIAALNGCTDNTAAVAREAGATVVESPGKGISFGRNLGARAATGDLLCFVDADTVLTPGALRRVAEAFHGHERAIACVGGAPDRGGGVVRTVFWIANTYAWWYRYSPPGPCTTVPRALHEAIAGWDESLPQGTVTDYVKRAQQAGATYLWVRGVRAITSIRRFEKKGVIWQMWAWRKNHADLEQGKRQAVSCRAYEDYR